jgi:uncharacterized protein
MKNQNLETDLKVIERLSKKNDKQNWAFRSFLKMLDMDDSELDSIVHEVNEKVSKQIDCTECGNCCKVIKPGFKNSDLLNFKNQMKTSLPLFKEKFMVEDREEPGSYVFKTLPCKFLEDNKCKNYESRPENCKSFPHLHKDEFRTRLWGVVENISICPIVFNVYEILKQKLWH